MNGYIIARTRGRRKRSQIGEGRTETRWPVNLYLALVMLIDSYRVLSTLDRLICDQSVAARPPYDSGQAVLGPCFWRRRDEYGHCQRTVKTYRQPFHFVIWSATFMKLRM